ncbi:unnamed protein product, partial [Polarella glacialis]
EVIPLDLALPQGPSWIPPQGAIQGGLQALELPSLAVVSRPTFVLPGSRRQHQRAGSPAAVPSWAQAAHLRAVMMTLWQVLFRI